MFGKEHLKHAAKMKTPLLGLTAIFLLCAGCDNEPDVAEPEGKTTSDPKESAAGAPEPLAQPSEIPEGLAGLQLTKNQATTINQWLDDQGEAVDPSDFAKYVSSVLRDDQQEEFRKIIETGGR